MIACRAPAKVNLALHVLGRRADGRHRLDTAVVFADVGEEITVAPAEGLSLRVRGPLAAHAPEGEGNLVWRAADLLRQRSGIRAGAAIVLTKRLPAGAGFGGGSADAAAAIKALNELWQTGHGAAALAELGLQLGADVPMCLHGSALRAGGIGEEIAPIAAWPDLPMVLVWPGVHVSTGAVFSRLSGNSNPPLPAVPAVDSIEALAGWLAVQRNDLQAPALRIAPAIGRALDRIAASHGCLLARMSGSGSGCFGLYPTVETSRAAADQMRREEPDWWVAVTLANQAEQTATP